MTLNPSGPTSEQAKLPKDPLGITGHLSRVIVKKQIHTVPNTNQITLNVGL